MIRVHPKRISAHALFVTAITTCAAFGAIAQIGGVPSTGKRPIGTRPFTGGPMPANVTKKATKQGRANVPTQTVDLTAGTATVRDTHVNWSKDERSMIFQSDRADLQGTSVGTSTHIYKMRPDGSGVTALTGPLATPIVGAAAAQSEPSYNTGASSVVYIEVDSAGALDLVELNLSTFTVKSLAKNNSKGISFTGFNHPEYGFAPGGNVGVLFSGQVGVGQPYHLFAVDTQSGIVTQLTSGAADDRNPTLSPDPNKPVVAFDSNRADASGATTKSTRDIWVIGTNPNLSNATKVTNFSVGSNSSSNIAPAWSTNKIDQPTGTQQIVNGQQLLGFASTRLDSANDGLANGINPNGSHDIYWIKVTIAVDPNNPSVYTVTTPESATNLAYKLPTSDPQHIYDDTNPSWPQFIGTYRVAYQSDRSFYNAGTNTSGAAGQPEDIFASTLIDLNSPTLVRYDDVTGDVLRVEPRISSPGSTVKISVKLSDLETGVKEAYVQIKNPNSKYQSADGKEHKVYISTKLELDNNNLAITNVEYEMQRIFVGSDPTDARVNNYSDPRYTASIDDFYAYSGSTHKADPSWLPLSLESFDSVTGIGTYTATWKTDVYPSDYVLDVMVYDNSLNPFTTNSGDAGSNWKIYDNVWGFTTQNFNPAHNILFVSDYAAGQKFFGSRFGINTLTNVANTFWGTESWMTDMDVSLLPSRYVNGTSGGIIVGALNPLGTKSYVDILNTDERLWMAGMFQPLSSMTSGEYCAGAQCQTRYCSNIHQERG